MKAKSLQERNKARAMLAAAPLMVAQLGALEFRKRMLKGDASILSSMRLEDSMTVSQVLKKLGELPPLTILKLCKKELGDFVTDSLLQHSDDLDFVQNILDVNGLHATLTPTLHAVLGGFSRRRNYGSFKHNQQSVAMDILRFAHLASPKDRDGARPVKRNRRSMGGESKRMCKYFQRHDGCRKNICQFEHKCIICECKSHGAIDCRDRLKGVVPLKHCRKDAARREKKRWKSVPPDSHRRRSR